MNGAAAGSESDDERVGAGGVSKPLQRAARILEVLAAAPEGLSLSDVAERVGLPMPSAHRLLGNLVDIELAASDGRRGRYRLGPRMHRLAQLCLGAESVQKVVEPELQALADQYELTAYIARYAEGEVTLSAAFMPRSPRRTVVHPGATFPINATAVGRVLFAYQPDAVVARALAQPQRRFRPRTPVSASAIREKLKQARASGYATSEDELDEATLAVAVPVEMPGGLVVFSIGLLGLKDAFLHDLSVDEAVEVLRGVASRLAPQLSSQGAVRD